MCVRYWLVTRKEPVFKSGAPRDTPELPVEVWRKGFLNLSEQIGAQLDAQVLAEREVPVNSAASPPVVAHANVILSALIGDRARLVISHRSAVRPHHAIRRPMSANLRGERGAQPEPGRAAADRASGEFRDLLRNGDSDLL